MTTEKLILSFNHHSWSETPLVLRVFVLLLAIPGAAATAMLMAYAEVQLWSKEWKESE